MENQVIDQATAAMRDSLTALEAEEARLSGELTTVKNQRRDVQKALESLTGDKPKRKRGRPRKNPAPEPVAA